MAELLPWIIGIVGFVVGLLGFRHARRVEKSATKPEPKQTTKVTPTPEPEKTADEHEIKHEIDKVDAVDLDDPDAGVVADLLERANALRRDG